MNTLELIDISPSIPSNSPRFGGSLNLTLTVTPDIANGEIGFTSNTTVVVYEPEDSNTSTVRYTKTISFVKLAFVRFHSSVLHKHSVKKETTMFGV